MEVDGMNNTDYGRMNKADLKKIVNDNIVLDVFIICQKLRHVQKV